MTIAVYDTTSGAISKTVHCPEGCEGANTLEGYSWINCEPHVTDRTHYVLNHTVCKFSEDELYIQKNIPQGWTWQMPERITIDLRNPAQTIIDDARILQESRATAYPPLADFADAMYWQAQGDNSKMEIYLASCAAVKAKYPKPS